VARVLTSSGVNPPGSISYSLPKMRTRTSSERREVIFLFYQVFDRAARVFPAVSAALAEGIGARG